MKRKAVEQDLTGYDQKLSKFQATGMNNRPPVPPQGPVVPTPTGCEGAEMELRRVMDNFVDVYEKLDTCNEVSVKPNYSYTELAYLAMLRSPNFCLPITEIYRYIQTRFLFFKNSTRKHWKNAVRHSLAKTLCFTKITVGRGTSNSEGLARSTYLWCIIPTSLVSFARGDYRPSVDRDSGTNTLRWGYYRVNAGQFWDQVGNFVAARMAIFKQLLETSPEPAKIFESQICGLTSLPGNHMVQTPVSLVPCQSFETPSPPEMMFSNDPTSPTLHHGYNVTQMTSPPLNWTYVQNQDVVNQAPQPCTAKSPDPGHDPWLPRTVISPNSSMSSQESDRRTPPFTSFDGRDSGNETLGSDSSPEETHSRRLASCRMQHYFSQSSPVLYLQSPAYCPDEHELQQLELSPFSGTDFSPFHNQLSYKPMDGSVMNSYSNQVKTEMPDDSYQYTFSAYEQTGFDFGLSAASAQSVLCMNGADLQLANHAVAPDWST